MAECRSEGFTVHFIDEEWKLRSRCLQLPEDHTGNIANALEGVHSSWNLHPSRQVSFTGSNIVSAARKLAFHVSVTICT